MSRFNSTAEVRAWAEKAAAEDYARHLPVHIGEDGSRWQCDRNPYSTAGGLLVVAAVLGALYPLLGAFGLR